MSERLVERLFPGFQEIKDQDLKEKSMRAFEMAMEEGGWDETTIGDAPVSLSYENCDVTLIEHVNDVTAMCLMEFDRMTHYYSRHKVPFDRDLIAAGALLHDIGKLTEFVPDGNGGAKHGDNYELMRHPLTGAIIAAKAGLPDKLVHLIATHSFEGDKSHHTLESDFVRKVDIFVFNCSVYGLKKKA